MAFIATLINRRVETETPSKPAVWSPKASRALPGVGKARHALEEGGTAGFASWMGAETRLLLADVSLERLQTPLLTSPVRTAELCELAAEVVRLSPELNILEVTSSEAVGDAITESRECPFRRIEELRRTAPGLVLRASLSAATCLGERVAPRSAFALAADELVDAGIDIIRISDPYNDIKRLAAASTAATLSDAVVEGVIVIDSTAHPNEIQKLIDRTIKLAKALEQHGAHTLVLEDRCGRLRPVGAYTVVRAVRREVSLPIWVRVIESHGYGLTTLIAAVEAGAAGVDTALPALAGQGIEPSNLAIATALTDTERVPDVTVLSLSTIDEHLERICKLLGGWNPSRRIPPDAPDLGLAPQVIEAVLARAGGPTKVSRDQVVSACDAARQALGSPAMVSPAGKAVTSLASQMLTDGEAAGPLIDRARADDPEGALDSMGSLREGGFPESTIETPQPTNRRELLELLWDEAATRFFEHQARFGHLELLPSVPLRYGLGPGDRFACLVSGEPREVAVRSVDADAETAIVTVDGQRIELKLRSKPASER